MVTFSVMGAPNAESVRHRARASGGHVRAPIARFCARWALHGNHIAAEEDVHPQRGDA
jgi:hypothetical protein